MVTTYGPLEVPLSEMLLLRSLTEDGRRPNLLLTCSDADIQTAFDQIRDLFRRPFHVCLLPGPLDLPPSGRGTLFLYDVTALALPQQIALYDWLGKKGRDVQVVSMTASQMLPLVETGRFFEGLYYRLTTIFVAAKG